MNRSSYYYEHSNTAILLKVTTRQQREVMF